MLAEEVLGEIGDVAAVRAERWHLDARDVESIEQIFAEPPFADGLRQVPVGRRDQPEVRSQRLLSAHLLEGAVRRARPAVAGLMKRGTSPSTLAIDSRRQRG